ncbi:RDD family protein [Parabacteroides sp. FAFU027]|uniref:RDD family protein n=1 Tax=Parabacteroides sp. FAFU027 TaxID=2922715 RepID=UPI001FAFACDD|nr:RDD family protein [Parabacteroides sp. FAFU027]
MEPIANSQTIPSYLALHPVGFWKRVLNCLIDTICYCTIYFIAKDTLLETFFKTYPEDGVVGIRSSQLVNVLIMFFYYLIWEASCGRTAGKFITRSVVIDEDGNLPSFKTTLYRTLCRFIPFEPISVLIHERIGWHDMFPRTRVVDVNEYRAERQESAS